MRVSIPPRQLPTLSAPTMTAIATAALSSEQKGQLEDIDRLIRNGLPIGSIRMAVDHLEEFVSIASKFEARRHDDFLTRLDKLFGFGAAALGAGGELAAELIDAIPYFSLSADQLSGEHASLFEPQILPLLMNKLVQHPRLMPEAIKFLEMLIQNRHAEDTLPALAQTVIEAAVAGENQYVLSDCADVIALIDNAEAHTALAGTLALGILTQLQRSLEPQEESYGGGRRTDVFRPVLFETLMRLIDRLGPQHGATARLTELLSQLARCTVREGARASSSEWMALSALLKHPDIPTARKEEVRPSLVSALLIAFEDYFNGDSEIDVLRCCEDVLWNHDQPSSAGLATVLKACAQSHYTTPDQLDRIAVLTYQADPDGAVFMPGTEYRDTKNERNPEQLVGGKPFTYPPELAQRRAILQNTASNMRGRVTDIISPLPLAVRELAQISEDYVGRPVQRSDGTELLNVLQAARTHQNLGQ